jgi:hypothetical protein
MSGISLKFLNVRQLEIENVIVEDGPNPIITFDCNSTCLRSRFLLRNFRMFDSYLINSFLSVIVAEMLIEELIVESPDILLVNENFITVSNWLTPLNITLNEITFRNIRFMSY